MRSRLRTHPHRTEKDLAIELDTVDVTPPSPISLKFPTPRSNICRPRPIVIDASNLTTTSCFNMTKNGLDERSTFDWVMGSVFFKLEEKSMIPLCLFSFIRKGT